MNNVIPVIDLSNFLGAEDKHRDGFVENEINLTCLKKYIDEAQEYTVTVDKYLNERIVLKIIKD